MKYSCFLASVVIYRPYPTFEVQWVLEGHPITVFFAFAKQTRMQNNDLKAIFEKGVAANGSILKSMFCAHLMYFGLSNFGFLSCKLYKFLYG